MPLGPERASHSRSSVWSPPADAAPLTLRSLLNGRGAATTEAARVAANYSLLTEIVPGAEFYAAREEASQLRLPVYPIDLPQAALTTKLQRLPFSLTALLRPPTRHLFHSSFLSLR